VAVGQEVPDGRRIVAPRLPPDIRRLIYTTNSLESVHAQLRKIIKTRDQFPTTKPPPH
jgi:transposase-like protein